MKENSEESWQSWYNRTGSGQLLRQACTAVCLLNEILFGVSDKLVDSFAMMFDGFGLRWDDTEECGGGSDNVEPHHSVHSASIWKISEEKCAKSHLIDSIGSILHEYLSPELWSLPLDHKSSFQQPDDEERITLHFFHDAALLYQERYIFLHQYSTVVPNDINYIVFIGFALVGWQIWKYMLFYGCVLSVCYYSLDSHSVESFI